MAILRIPLLVLASIMGTPEKRVETGSFPSRRKGEARKWKKQDAFHMRLSQETKGLTDKQKHIIND
jgi:hypothetical protein